MKKVSFAWEAFLPILLPATLLTGLGANGSAQAGSPDQPFYDPGSEAAFEQTASSLARAIGDDSLADAIENGDVDVFYGSCGEGAVACSAPGPSAGKGAIFVYVDTSDYAGLLASVEHERYHLSNPAGTTPPPADPGPSASPPAKEKYGQDYASGRRAKSTTPTVLPWRLSPS